MIQPVQIPGEELDVPDVPLQVGKIGSDTHLLAEEFAVVYI
jgi:hypothetical protein